MKKLNFKRTLISVVFGFFVSAVLLFISACILCFTGVSEKYSDVFVVVSALAGIFTSGVVSSLKASSSGWLRGAVSGFAYMVLLYLARGFFPGDTTLLQNILRFAIGIITGIIGGITGININFRKNRN